MSRIFSLFLALSCLAGAAAGQVAGGQPAPKLVLDLWDAAFLQGSRAGHVHTFVHEIDKDGVKLLRATMELRLAVKRSGEVTQLGMDNGTYETPDGKVVGTFLKHFLGKAKTLQIDGIVRDGML